MSYVILILKNKTRLIVGGKMGSISKIIRNYDGSPLLVTDTIEENCEFENTMIEGFGTIIIDKDFLEDSSLSITDEEASKGLVYMLTTLRNKIVDYYCSDEENVDSRKQTYASNYLVNEEGLILGTKLSSLKGKNISECSEKSIAAYVVLERLFKAGKITRKPTLILSSLSTESCESEPHAFLLIDKESDDYPTKHILFDPQNPTDIKDISNDKESRFVGLYSLSDEEYESIVIGKKCTPKSLYEFMSPNYKEFGEKRFYGSKEQIKER